MSQELNFKPILDRILVQPDPQEEQTASGLYLAGQENQQITTGTVVAVGSGNKDDGKTAELEVTVGDHVHYSKFGGTNITIEDEEYLVLRESDILGVDQG